MYTIHPKIVTDEKKHPIAVQIDYEDWLQIKKILERENTEKNLDQYAGCINLNEDPLDYQKRVRDEWL